MSILIEDILILMSSMSIGLTCLCLLMSIVLFDIPDCMSFNVVYVHWCSLQNICILMSFKCISVTHFFQCKVFYENLDWRSLNFNVMSIRLTCLYLIMSIMAIPDCMSFNVIYVHWCSLTKQLRFNVIEAHFCYRFFQFKVVCVNLDWKSLNCNVINVYSPYMFMSFNVNYEIS